MCLQDQTLQDQTESQEHDNAKTGEMKRNEEQNLCQQAVSPRGKRWGRKERCWWTRRGRDLGDLTVNSGPALVALAGELVLHVQDIVVVEVTYDMETGAPAFRVVANVKKARVEVQVNAWIQALANTSAILLAKCFAAQLGCRRHVDHIMSQRPIDVVLHSQAVLLKKQGGIKQFETRIGGSSSRLPSITFDFRVQWIISFCQKTMLDFNFIIVKQDIQRH